MKLIKRIWMFCISFILMFLFCLQCSLADVTYCESHHFVFEGKNRVIYFRDPQYEGDLKSPTLDSYAVCFVASYKADETDLKCETYAVNEYFGSEYDHLYTTAAYVSLSITLQSGENLFVEEVSRCTVGSSAYAGIFAATMDDFAQNDVIKEFESNHMIYNLLPKYSIEFAPGKVWIEKIIFEPPEETSERGRSE